MRDQIRQQVVAALQLRNTFFMRELDIQIYLANYFINLNVYDNVFLEYHIPSNLIPNYPWADNIYIDIVLEKDHIYYPVEIKYKTKAQELPLNLFGTGINVSLRQQGASNIGCYDFWKDIRRVELFQQAFNNVEKGFVLFISNDSTYFEPPYRTNVGYAQFSIHQNRVVPQGSLLNWNGQLKIAEGRPSIFVNYGYSIVCNELQLADHQYILT